MLDYKFFMLAIISLVLLTLSSCGNELAKRDATPEKPSGPAAAVQTTSHRGVGVVKALNPKVPSIEVDHEEIKGFMPAMQMEFHVKDKSLLDGLAPADKIEFTVEYGVGGMKISAIKKL
jgi:Cu/Ag efflux protein CusF